MMINIQLYSTIAVLLADLLTPKWYRCLRFILEDSLMSLEDKLSRDLRHLKVNIGCKLAVYQIARRQYKRVCFHHLNTLFMSLNFLNCFG